MFYYFDTETTGFSPKEDCIISAQIQPIFDNGEPRNALEIYKTWGEDKLTEDDIVDMLYQKLMVDDIWSFIPVSFNIKFDFKFLAVRFMQKYPKFDTLKLFDRPFLDLHTLAVMVNGGSFKNSGLDHISEKKEDGANIPIWYKNREFDKIDAYVKQEAESFLKFYRKYFNLLSGTGVVKHG